MNLQCAQSSRRQWLVSGTGAILGSAIALGAPDSAAAPGKTRKAQIAITLDLEMSRNFPRWEDTHWDYEKGNLDDAAKKYTVAVAERVKARGGRIHCFCVGRVLEQPDVEWLRLIAGAGHAVGNHTYDHVNLLAQTSADLQFRFQRAPWLIEGRTPAEVIRENIRLTTLALKERIGIENRGFRAPGGFQSGLEGREDLQHMLLELGFRWISSMYPVHANSLTKQAPSDAVYDSIVQAQAKAQPLVYPTGLIEVPMSPISDIGAFRTGQWKLPWFIEAVRRAATWAIEHQAVFDFLAHPSCLGVVDPQFETIDMLCDLVKAAGDAAQFADLDQIAASV
jgi:hypothetical protein